MITASVSDVVAEMTGDELDRAITALHWRLRQTLQEGNVDDANAAAKDLALCLSAQLRP